MSQYGLILRKSKKQDVHESELFDEPDAEQPAEKPRQPAAPRKKLESSRDLQKQALDEDPLVYDYDAYLDSKKRAKVAETDKAPKYMGSIMRRAAERKIEAASMQERRLQKEIEADRGTVGDKEMFITAAYREKLAERERLREQLQAQESDSPQDMTDFYRNLLRNKK